MRRKPSRSYRSGRLWWRLLLLLVLAAGASTLLGPPSGLAGADAVALAQGGDSKVTVFGDATIGPNEVRDTVVVVGGNLVVHGTVENMIVIVGGDLLIASDGRVGVGQNHTSQDAAYVSVLGAVTVEPGAVVSGREVHVARSGAGAFHASITDPIVRPWKGWGAIGGWIGSTIFIALVALIAAAIAPRQIVFVSERTRRHLFSSLGWGALGLIIVVPLVTILLIVTLVGILALLPWWLFVIVALLFGYAAVGTLIGRLINGRNERRGRIMLAAVIGVLVLSVVRWIPIAGSIIVFLALLVGLGAVVTGLWEWRRRPRVPAGPPGGTYGPRGPYGSGEYQPPAPPGPSSYGPPEPGSYRPPEQPPQQPPAAG